MEIRSVQYKDTKIEYELTIKPVKNINLRINIYEKVCVSANKYVPVSRIDSFVLEHGDFIIDSVKKMRRLKEREKIDFSDGGYVLIAGNKTSLSLRNSIKNAVKYNVQENRIIIYSKNAENIDLCKKQFQKWMREYAKKYVESICTEIYPLFKEYELKYPEIRIRNMKTKWGSCQPYNGIVTFNLKLAEKPKKAVEYVVVHEFAHFVVPNHSKKFYAVVSKYMPDWKYRKEQLN